MKSAWRLLPPLVVTFVFMQSLFFKFSGSMETRYIFGTLGSWSGLAWFGDYGAYLVGAAELLASLLLWRASTRRIGAGIAWFIMSGAIFFHLFTPLGISMPEYAADGRVVGYDGGLLFIMACVTWVCAGWMVLNRRKIQRATLRLNGPFVYEEADHAL